MKEENFRTKREENPPPSLPIIYVLNNTIVAKEKEKEKRRERKGRERERRILITCAPEGEREGGRKLQSAAADTKVGPTKTSLFLLSFSFFSFLFFLFKLSFF